MSVLLEANGLSIKLKRDGRTLLQPADFILQPGEALAIIGESGSGKTITCKAIMRLLDRKVFEISGSIRFRGEELLAMHDKSMRRLCGSKLAMIVQNPMSAFNPTVKIGEHIVETVRAHKDIRRKDAYAMGIAALEGMNLPRAGQLMNSYPYTLSGGMLQRVVIALSLMLEPELIIADEPTTALDVQNQKLVLDELERIKGRGIGILLVTHDIGVAARIADRVLVMKDGEAVESGNAFDILHSPREAYTKELLKASRLDREGMP